MDFYVYICTDSLSPFLLLRDASIEKIFPVYFGNFLHQYMEAFTDGVEDFEGSLKPDQRIQRFALSYAT